MKPRNQLSIGLVAFALASTSSAFGSPQDSTPPTAEVPARQVPARQVPAHGGIGATELGRAHLAEVELRYQRESWPEGALRNGIPIVALELEGWRRGQMIAEGPLISVPFHPAESSHARPAFVIEAMVGKQVRESQDQLVTWLAGLQNPNPMPRARARGIEAGELGFVGPSNRGENAVSWIAFVRGNVAVRVLVTDPRAVNGLQMATVARAVDASILEGPALAADAVLPEPRVDSLVATPSEVVAGTPVALEYEIAAPFARGHHVQWVVGGPGQGYVERGRDGKLYLHPTGPGHITLEMQVTASNGTVTERAVEIEVSDD